MHSVVISGWGSCIEEEGLEAKSAVVCLLRVYCCILGKFGAAGYRRDLIQSFIWTPPS